MRAPLECAEWKGREAAKAGKPEAACPYEDKRTFNGSVTFSRSFIRAWLKGHRSVSRA